jgi:hypothetical protein
MTVSPLASVVMNSRSGSPPPRSDATGLRAADFRSAGATDRTPLRFRFGAEVFVDTIKTLPDNDR